MRYLVTGGAGFIGSNAAARFASEGHEVLAFDNLSRAGSRTNAAWLAGAALGHDRVRERERLRGRARRGEPLRPRRRPALRGPGGGDAARSRTRATISRPTRSAPSISSRPCGSSPPGPSSSSAPPTRSTAASRTCGWSAADGRWTWPDLPQGLHGRPAPRLPFPLRLLQGGGRPVRARLRPHLRSAHGGLPPVLHLRLSAVRRRGAGLGGLVHHQERPGGAR